MGRQVILLEGHYASRVWTAESFQAMATTRVSPNIPEIISYPATNTG